jgi:hypothetical protein
MSTIKSILGNAAEQRELFLMKFSDIDRLDVLDMYEAFLRFDKKKSGDLDEHEIQLMMADLGVHKTLVELRQMLSTIDFTLGKKIQFMELLCASFGKDYQALLDHTDPQAVANAKAKADAAKAIEDAIAAKRAEDEAADMQLQADLEKEANLVSHIHFSYIYLVICLFLICLYTLYNCCCRLVSPGKRLTSHAQPCPIQTKP